MCEVRKNKKVLGDNRGKRSGLGDNMQVGLQDVP